MTVTKAALISTGAALRHAEQKLGVKKEDIAKVTIDGKDVKPEDAAKELAALEKAIDDAEAAAKKAEAEKAAKPPSVFARVGSWASETIGKPSGKWIDANLPALNDVTNDAMAGLNQTALAKPEDVDHTAIVRIETRAGKSFEIPVKVRDEMTTQILKATSATVSSAGLVPFFGNFVQGGTGILAMVASGATALVGEKDLSRALAGMGKKHLVMGLVGFIPGVGSVTSVGAIHDVRRLGHNEINVSEIVESAPAGP